MLCRTPYVDVCDDADYAQMLKGYSGQAEAAGVPAITSAGTALAHKWQTVFEGSSPHLGRYQGWMQANAPLTSGLLTAPYISFCHGMKTACLHCCIRPSPYARAASHHLGS